MCGLRLHVDHLRLELERDDFAGHPPLPHAASILLELRVSRPRWRRACFLVALATQGCRHEVTAPSRSPEPETPDSGQLQRTPHFDAAATRCTPRFQVVVGIGLVVAIRAAKLTIISPIQGSPAAEAGLQAGDVIVKIGEERAESMEVEEAVARIRGAANTSVELWVARTGWAEPRRFVVERVALRGEQLDGCAETSSTAGP